MNKTATRRENHKNFTGQRKSGLGCLQDMSVAVSAVMFPVQRTV